MHVWEIGNDNVLAQEGQRACNIGHVLRKTFIGEMVVHSEEQDDDMGVGKRLSADETVEQGGPVLGGWAPISGCGEHFSTGDDAPDHSQVGGFAFLSD